MKNEYMERPFRRIFAVVDSETFSLFARRTKEENVSIGDAFSTLVKLYANGALIALPKKSQMKKESFSYLEESKKGELNENSGSVD